ncbi:hypothetical protein CC85DRAFT_63473 [Cutaneotrichosporon oleaginosum]|uniref:Uncharacterized protein n=1 Tax=Cutaneotrichosporon oleaginosum TaxID=879819 RepID=A0A0J0XPY6_9TREE|nr:uncharacterized protein CC85DRAFT_63473 [Cutaneotrichosporon oleaginosum]KLT43163.1 hypothetical protein CC85DRAFT_63473 [Cutaneotrichosporon oleaginosum]TXT09845.1 hypothetical protein COLE_03779 [Cutaneotrichosporon oleaginosum]
MTRMCGPNECRGRSWQHCFVHPLIMLRPALRRELAMGCALERQSPLPLAHMTTRSSAVGHQLTGDRDQDREGQEGEVGVDGRQRRPRRRGRATVHTSLLPCDSGNGRSAHRSRPSIPRPLLPTHASHTHCQRRPRLSPRRSSKVPPVGGCRLPRRPACTLATQNVPPGHRAATRRRAVGRRTAQSPSPLRPSLLSSSSPILPPLSFHTFVLSFSHSLILPISLHLSLSLSLSLSYNPLSSSSSQLLVL